MLKSAQGFFPKFVLQDQRDAFVDGIGPGSLAGYGLVQGLGN
jgi:hypothetical protein